MTTRQKQTEAAYRQYGPHHTIYTAVETVKKQAQPMYFYKSLLDSKSVEKGLFKRLQRLSRARKNSLHLRFPSTSPESKALQEIRKRLMQNKPMTTSDGKELNYPKLRFSH